MAPNLVMNFFIQIASLGVSLAAMYSVSIIKSSIVYCLEFFQLTTPSFRVKIYPEVDLLSSESN